MAPRLHPSKSWSPVFLACGLEDPDRAPVVRVNDVHLGAYRFGVLGPASKGATLVRAGAHLTPKEIGASPRMS